MKIAILAPVWLPVPPQGYGGTELIASLLTEGLVKRGHDVTLFASGDSKTSAHLASVFPTALGNNGELKHQALLPLLHFTHCFERAEQFDLIHNHAQYYAMFFTHYVKTPVVHTLHGSFTRGEVLEDKLLTLTHFKDSNFVSISDAQRNGLPDLHYLATVYNGIQLERFDFRKENGEYLLWAGRVVRKKGPLEAIEVAKRTSLPLKMVAAIDPVDRPFFEAEVQPQIDGEQITFHGEVSNEEMAKFFQGALATLVPISWEEPFGLVMAESMACGTPVIAYNRGSVPEVVKDGETGFIIDPEEETGRLPGQHSIKDRGIDGMVTAVKRIEETDRTACRKRVEENFTVEKMLDGYEETYKQLLSK